MRIGGDRLNAYADAAASEHRCGDVQEEFYLEENVEKAIAIDEWSPDALTTSMVDDVFFILQKCGGRALAVGSLQPLCAILGQLNTLLRDALRSALELKWKVRPALSLHPPAPNALTLHPPSAAPLRKYSRTVSGTPMAGWCSLRLPPCVFSQESAMRFNASAKLDGDLHPL